MHYVPVLMVVAIVAILVAVVIVAIGRGGEMARFPNDYAPPELGALAATDVALLKPPAALWGYHMQATDEALGAIAMALSERDVRIASLERQLSDLRADTGRPGPRAPAPQETAWPVDAPGTATRTGAGALPTEIGGPARSPRRPPRGAAETAGSGIPDPAVPTSPGAAERAPTGWWDRPVATGDIATGAATARHARPQEGAGPAGVSETANTPTEGTEDTASAQLTSDTVTTDAANAPGEPSGQHHSGGSGRTGTGWPDHTGRSAPSREHDQGASSEPGQGPMRDAGRQNWPGWPGASARRQNAAAPGPQGQSRPPEGRARPQSDEEEAW